MPRAAVPVALHPLAQNPGLGAGPLAWSQAFWHAQLPGFHAPEWRDFYQQAAVADYSRWDFAAADSALIFLAVVANEVIGAIALTSFDELEAYRHLRPWFAAFIIKPALRGHGYGTQILALMERQARSYGIQTVYLWTEDAMGFYRKNAYSEHAKLSVGGRTRTIFEKTLGRT